MLHGWQRDVCLGGITVMLHIASTSLLANISCMKVKQQMCYENSVATCL
jgi:hypothetical protein